MRSGIIAALIVGNIAMVLVSNCSFKYSAMAHATRPFLAWQVVGNTAGFLSVITLTLLLRQTPLHIAYPVTAGLGFLLVQVVGAAALFHETISLEQWIGTGLLVAGVVMVSHGAR